MVIYHTPSNFFPPVNENVLKKESTDLISSGHTLQIILQDQEKKKGTIGKYDA